MKLIDVFDIVKRLALEVVEPIGKGPQTLRFVSIDVRVRELTAYTWTELPRVAMDIIMSRIQELDEGVDVNSNLLLRRRRRRSGCRPLAVLAARLWWHFHGVRGQRVEQHGRASSLSDLRHCLRITLVSLTHFGEVCLWLGWYVKLSLC